jgi:hypothetical protein
MAVAPRNRSHPEAGELEALIAPAHREETPLPKLQLAILCAVRLAEPIAYTQVRPPEPSELSFDSFYRSFLMSIE